MDKNRKRILFGFKSVPYPLRADGVAVRYLPIIEHMSQHHDIDVFVIIGAEEDLRNLEGLKAYCRKIFVLQDPRQSHKKMSTKCKTYAKFLLPWTPPISVVAHNGSQVTRGILEQTKGERYDAVIWVGADLLPHLVDALPSMSVGKVFVDFIDSPFLWALRRKDKVFSIRALNRYERWKTYRWEKEIVRNVDGSIYISRVDADATASDHSLNHKRIVVPNGISVPQSANAERMALPSPNIGFLGTMGYPPNVEAVEWLYKEVFAPLRMIRPDLFLIVIGRNPSASIRALAERPGVIVTGGVDDIWPYMNGIDVFLFPLFHGAGLKNKILEAMYAGRPVVTTEIGNEGIDAHSGIEIVVARTPEEFQREAMRLLDSPAERGSIGEAALSFVKTKFSWGPILSAYEEFILGDLPSPGPENPPGRDQ